MVLKNKKGAVSHIEMILSFIIFVGFLIFLFAIFKPFRIASSSETYVDVVERGIKENVSVNVNFQTLKLTGTNPGCFCIPYSLKKVIVKNVNEVKILDSNVETDGNRLCIKNSQIFFYISSSEEFPNNIGNLYNPNPPGDICDELTDNYDLGLFRTYDFYSNRKLNKLHSDTLNNYDEVKDYFDITSSKDFSFSVRDKEDGIIIKENTKKAVTGVRVIARDVPIQRVNNNGNYDYLLLNIRVW
tara:strand:- start:1273 stop:2001 length:729 start_codon:yes stop_codon:yes gene_type:complete